MLSIGVEVRNANKESNDSVMIIHYSTIEKMFVFTPRHKFCFSTNLSKDFMMAQGWFKLLNHIYLICLATNLLSSASIGSQAGTTIPVQEKEQNLDQ